MTTREKVNILLVDDQPGKLLSLEAILADLGEHIIKANSADEALKHLLGNDIAVVLVDVCMPRMDGFELAELIRGHPRFKRTAIIFISAVHLSDDDRLKGYGLGAVDYIPVPIVPEVLRAKVAVFADLHRKTDELERLNQQLEQRVAERTADLNASAARLRDSEQRYRQLVQGLPAAVYCVDRHGRLTLYNDASVALWGEAPDLGADVWSGSWRQFRPDGTPLPDDECPLAVTLRRGEPVRGEELILERADGSRRVVFPYPEPIRDESGAVVGAINMLMDVTEQRTAQEALRESEAKFRTLADNIAQLAWMADGSGAVFWYNRRWFEYTGRTAAESAGWGWIDTIHPDHGEHVVAKIRACFATGESWEDTFPTRAADGSYRWFLCRAFPVKDECGRVQRWFGTGTDVTEQREAQQVLARDRETLEQLVAERTAELAATNERLRLADRMATIGTLSAGLGHDMGNLLLPVRMRLDAVESCTELPASVREDLAAIRKASEYLQRLARSLRLLALDPQSEGSEDACTDLTAWWEDAEGMLRNGVVRPTMLRAELSADLPPVRIGKAALTQVVFNLVQNAGDALRAREDGVVTIVAHPPSSGDVLRLSIIDNGPGMDDRVRDRCLEPFFTTKTRGLSTGLGLTLVSGLIKRAGGSIQIHSEPGRGTSFTLILPIARHAPVPGLGHASQPSLAVISIKDRRLAAHVEAVLSSLAYEVRHGEAPSVADVWITETDGESGIDAVRSFVVSRPDCRAFVLGVEPDSIPDQDRLHPLGARLKPSELRTRLRAALAGAEDPGAPA